MACRARETSCPRGRHRAHRRATVVGVPSSGGVDTELLEGTPGAATTAAGRSSRRGTRSTPRWAPPPLWIYDPAGLGRRRTTRPAWLFGEQTTVALESRRPVLVGLPGEVAEGEEAWDDDIEDPDAAFTAIVERSLGAGSWSCSTGRPAEPDDSAPLDDLYDTLPGLARPEAPARRGVANRGRPPRRTQARRQDPRDARPVPRLKLGTDRSSAPAARGLTGLASAPVSAGR